MSWVLVLTLIGGCLATPLQQGNLKIVRYTANKDGLYPSHGIPIAPQPVVYNPQQPLVIEPSPLTYSSVGGSSLTERDQQRHINIDDEIEAREEALDEEPKPVEEPKVDLNNEPKDETVVRVDDQKPVPESGSQVLVGSSVVSGVKGGFQPVSIDSEQLFPSVADGQRRLIEPQPQLYSSILYPQLYGSKSKVVPSHSVFGIQQQQIPQQHRVVYHNLQPVQQQQSPIQVEEQKITAQGVQVRKPVVQYQVNPFQQPYVPREWLRKPIQSGVKGGQQPIQYFIQPIIPSDLTYVSPGQQRQVFNLQPNVQGGVRIQQKGQSVHQEEVKVDRVDVPNVPKRDLDSPVQFGQSVDVEQPVVQDLNSVQGLQGVVQQQQQRPDSVSQKQGVKSAVDHSLHKVVVQTSQHQVPVVGGQQLIGYQLVGQQPQQIVLQQPIHSGVQYVQHAVQVPISDIQRYYQLVQSAPIQPIGQHGITYAFQSPQVIDQSIQYQLGQLGQSAQPVQSPQVIQSVSPIDAPVGLSGLSVGGLQGSQRIQGLTGVQQIQLQDNRSVGGLKGQDLRVNLRPLGQRQQRSFIGGVKGAVNV